MKNSFVFFNETMQTFKMKKICFITTLSRFNQSEVETENIFYIQSFPITDVISKSFSYFSHRVEEILISVEHC